MLPPREIIAASYYRVVEHAANGELAVAYEEIPHRATLDKLPGKLKDLFHVISLNG